MSTYTVYLFITCTSRLKCLSLHLLFIIDDHNSTIYMQEHFSSQQLALTASSLIVTMEVKTRNLTWMSYMQNISLTILKMYTRHTVALMLSLVTWVSARKQWLHIRISRYTIFNLAKVRYFESLQGIQSFMREIYLDTTGIQVRTRKHTQPRIKNTIWDLAYENIGSITHWHLLVNHIHSYNFI